MRFLLIALILSACGPNYHLRKAIQKGAEVKVDTVYQEIIVPKTVTDTVVRFQQVDKLFTDTIFTETVRYKSKLKIDTITKTIYQQVECKPDTIRVPVQFKTEIKSGGRNFYIIGFYLLAIIVCIWLIRKFKPV